MNVGKALVSDWIRRSGAGDANAMVALSRAALLSPELPMPSRLAIAEMFARLSASQGKPDGFRQLATVLILAGSHLLSTGAEDDAAAHAGHAAAIFDMLSDAGDPDAASLLESLLAAAEVDGLRSRVLTEAKRLGSEDLACV